MAEGLRVALLLWLVVTEKEGEEVGLRDCVSEVVKEEEAVPLGVKERACVTEAVTVPPPSGVRVKREEKEMEGTAKDP